MTLYTVERILPSGARMVMEGWTHADIGRASAAGVPVTVIAAGHVPDNDWTKVERDPLAFAQKVTK